jgi:ElaB/YqjD/DUF883 family membrane-anchored ribosome-binding protein
MPKDADDSPMTQEDRLKAVLYQFIKLYERWSEDRQVAARQGADMAELAAEFSAQVKLFKSLEPKVREKIVTSIETASANIANNVGEAVGKEAAKAVEDTIQQLNESVEQAQYVLNRYEKEVATNQWKVIGVSALVTIATCLLLVRFLIPQPTLPLTNFQAQMLSNGIEMYKVWPKLTKEEQDHWQTLSDAAWNEERNKKS